ncbi:MAG: alpha-ketoglutarate-dependent dioxygenase AlkB [Flavobacteriales bacterium]
MASLIYKEHVFSDYDIKTLCGPVDWRQNDITIFGKTYPEPRLTAWYGPPYKYSSIQWEAQDMPEFLKALQRETEQLCNFSFNAALLNYYRDGQDSMGWHSDDEKEIDQSCIASLSFGASRKLKFRLKSDHSVKEELILTHGSLLIMNDYQELWQHSIPKTKRVSEPRLNITFRRVRLEV